MNFLQSEQIKNKEAVAQGKILLEIKISWNQDKVKADTIYNTSHSGVPGPDCDLMTLFILGEVKGETEKYHSREIQFVKG